MLSCVKTGKDFLLLKFKFYLVFALWSLPGFTQDDIQVVSPEEYIVSKMSIELAYDRKDMVKLNQFTQDRGNFLCQLRTQNPESKMTRFSVKFLDLSRWNSRPNQTSQLHLPVEGRLEQIEPLFSQEWFYVKYPAIDSSNRLHYLQIVAGSSLHLYGTWFICKVGSALNPENWPLRLGYQLFQGFLIVRNYPNTIQAIRCLATNINSALNFEITAEEAQRMVEEGRGRLYMQTSGNTKIPYELFEEVWCSQ